MSVKLHDFEQRLEKSESTTTDLVKSVSFISDQYDSVTVTCAQNTSEISRIDTDVQNLKQENDELRSTLSSLNDLNKSLKEDLLDLKCRSMRDNLVFTNIPEHFKTLDRGRRFEDTEQVLTSFLSKQLDITGIQFERVHRIFPAASRNQNRQDPRPIVAKFTLFKEREQVRRASFKLAGTRFGINEQFPEEIEQNRRKLYPVLRQLRRQKEKVTLVKDKLIVDGREVRPEDLPQLRRYDAASGPQPREANNSTAGPRRASETMDTHL